MWLTALTEGFYLCFLTTVSDGSCLWLLTPCAGAHVDDISVLPEVQLQLGVQVSDEGPPGTDLSVTVVDHQTLGADVLAIDAFGTSGESYHLGLPQVQTYTHTHTRTHTHTHTPHTLGECGTALGPAGVWSAQLCSSQTTAVRHFFVGAWQQIPSFRAQTTTGGV